MKPEFRYFIRVFWSDEDDCFIAEVPELPNCSGLGKNEKEAMNEARKSIAGWMTVAKKNKIPIPKPISQTRVERLNLRIPADVVQRLKRAAKEMGMSLNQFVMSKLL